MTINIKHAIIPIKRSTYPTAIHGDLFTELFNKGAAGPFRSGFSTDTDVANCWVNSYP